MPQTHGNVVSLLTADVNLQESMEVFVVATSAVVGFLSVLIGRWLHLDYSAKLWAMTFVLVVMVSSPGMPRNAACMITVISGTHRSAADWCHAGLALVSMHELLRVYVMSVCAQAAEHSREAAIVAATRISGIVFGVFLSLLLCVVIFPKSATHEAVDNMWHAMTDLSALHALAWTGGRHEGPPGARVSRPSQLPCYARDIIYVLVSQARG